MGDGLEVIAIINDDHVERGGREGDALELAAGPAEPGGRERREGVHDRPEGPVEAEGEEKVASARPVPGRGTRLGPRLQIE